MELPTKFKGKLLLAAFLGVDGGGVEAGGVNYKQAKSSHLGDLFFSRETAARVRKKLRDEVFSFT